MQSRHLNCTLMSYIHFFTCALFIACFCPQLHPHHPPGKHCSVFFCFFCEWGVNGVCSTSHLSTGSVWHLLLELMTHRALVARNFMLRLERFNESRCHLFFSPPGIEMDYTCICKLLLTVCASEVATWFAAFFFSFYLYIPPNPSLPSSLHPLWSRCTVIPLPSHLLHPHAHLLSVSHKATFRSRERKLLMKRNRSFFNHTLPRSHLLTLISSLSASHFACSIVLRWQMVY